MLYAHALGSIFQFCSLSDLHSIWAVSRDWSAAVLSMASIRGSRRVISIDQLQRMARSRFARHIAQVKGECVSSLEGLRILTEKMPWIRKLVFVWRVGQGDWEAKAAAISRLHRMTSLSLELACNEVLLTIESMDQIAAVTNSLIAVAGRLPR